MEFLNELGLWFDQYKETILTYLGVTGTSGVISGSAVAYIKSKFNDIKNVNSEETKVLKEELTELKKSNEILMEYVKADSEVKSQSNVLSDEVKYKFQTIADTANETKTNLTAKIADIKDNFGF